MKILDHIYDVGIKHLPHFARPVFVTFETIEFTDNHKISKKIFRDPVLPNGKHNNLEVYYLDSRRGYRPLDAEAYQKICNGAIRL